MMAYAEIELLPLLATDAVQPQCVQRALRLVGWNPSSGDEPLELHGEAAEVLACVKRLRMTLQAQQDVPPISMCVKVDTHPEKRRARQAAALEN